MRKEEKTSEKSQENNSTVAPRKPEQKYYSNEGVKSFVNYRYRPPRDTEETTHLGAINRSSDEFFNYIEQLKYGQFRASRFIKFANVLSHFFVDENIPAKFIVTIALLPAVQIGAQIFGLFAGSLSLSKRKRLNEETKKNAN